MERVVCGRWLLERSMTEEPDQTSAVIEATPGGAALLAWMGGSPNFGDAELVALTLDCSGRNLLKLDVETRARGRREYARVTLVLTDMIDVSLAGFSRQNVIGGLRLRWATDRPVHPTHSCTGLGLGDIEIDLKPCFGAFGAIRASLDAIEVAPKTYDT
ncbi:hypothetical protein [Methylobacterium sp. Leaf106]|uniref:hypothetical protein n=1 Tax=Methylobacterium sp. Leaf106 TaxID=1736255 RepID=UPI0006FF38FD|nr:hypothetical protein [Methylobacterium sp. Leaf106]KQP52128.1 hypothetical protein ASF34_18380 [Methylobacterium sp. Leaf106]